MSVFKIFLLLLSPTLLTPDPWVVLQSVNNTSEAYPLFLTAFKIEECWSLSIRSHLFNISKCGRTPNRVLRKRSFRPLRGIWRNDKDKTHFVEIQDKIVDFSGGGRTCYINWYGNHKGYTSIMHFNNAVDVQQLPLQLLHTCQNTKQIYLQICWMYKTLTSTSRQHVIPFPMWPGNHCKKFLANWWPKLGLRDLSWDIVQ